MDDRRGFTLLEVLVSLAILSATLLLAYQVISGAIAAEVRSERWTSATCLAEALGPPGRARRRPGGPRRRHLVRGGAGGAGHPLRRRRQVMRPLPPGRRGGVTLVEILLALSVLSVGLLLLLSSFTGADRK